MDMKNRTILIQRSHSLIAPISLYGIKVLIEDGVHVITEGHCYGQDNPCPRGLGCQIVDKQYWETAAHDTIVVGFDEPTQGEDPITQQHFYFSSIFDDSLPTSNLLNRFFWGNGQLYDLSIILGHPKSYYLEKGKNLKEATNLLEQDFLPLLLDFVGKKENAIWTIAEQKFNQAIANHKPT